MLKEVRISDPRVPVYSNATARPVAGAGEVAGLLARQLVEPVRWEDTLRDLVAAGKTEMVRRRCRADQVRAWEISCRAGLTAAGHRATVRARVLNR